MTANRTQIGNVTQGPSVAGWVKKMWSIQAVAYCPVSKKYNTDGPQKNRYAKGSKPFRRKYCYVHSCDTGQAKPLKQNRGPCSKL